MEKAKIRPFATPKPLNRSSQKLAGVITSWTASGMQNDKVNRQIGVKDFKNVDYFAPG